jgi:hypothetical protein
MDGWKKSKNEGTIHQEYVMHLFNVFQNICSPGAIPRITTSTASFNSLSLPCLNIYRDLFYPLGIKIVPHNIGALLTALGLAIWSMDDGSKVGSGFFLNTQSFTKEECLLLIGVLKENFDLDCTGVFLFATALPP